MYYFINIILSHVFFFFLHWLKLAVFYGNLSDSKSHQISRTLLSILDDFNGAMV